MPFFSLSWPFVSGTDKQIRYRQIWNILTFFLTFFRQMESEKPEVESRISRNSTLGRKKRYIWSVCVREGYGGSEKDFQMVCNRKRNYGKMKVWGWNLQKEEIRDDTEFVENTSLRLQQAEPLFFMWPPLFGMPSSKFSTSYSTVWEIVLRSCQESRLGRLL